MLIPGLVSITFRNLEPADIVDLVARAQLRAIEWGGDIHVPHGDVAAAREVARITADAGLAVAAYGSYFRVADDPAADAPSFDAVLETAVALGAPVIRTWSGIRGSADADDAYRERVAEETIAIADCAAREGIGITFEFHGGTLTDSNESARRLADGVPHPGVTFGWQPKQGESVEWCLEGLQALAPSLGNLHVFTWTLNARGHVVRHPLVEGTAAWSRYLDAAGEAPGDRHALIEFVCDDDPDAFLADARVLRAWLGARSSA